LPRKIAAGAIFYAYPKSYETAERMGKPSHTNPIHAVKRFLMEAAHCTSRLRTGVLAVAVMTFAPHCTAQATALPLILPSAIVFDAQGNLYFAETGNHAVRMFSTAGVITTVAGNGTQGFAGDNGPATAAELDSPSGLAFDLAGNLYIADTHNHRVREVAATTGVITTIAGTGSPGYSGDAGVATAAQLGRPTALAIDSAGDLFIADADSQCIRRVAAGTGVITTVAGNGIEGFGGDGGPAMSASIDSPNGLAVDAAGDLYIADTHNGRIRKINVATGIITTVAGAGSSNGNVQSFGGDGGSATAAGLALPRGITLDAAGNLYIADSANHRIRRISTAGVIATVAGQGTETFAGDGAPAIAASLDTPRSVAVSPAGLLTLTDTGNQRVRQLDALPAPGPDIHTIAGLGNTVAGVLILSGSSVVTYGSGVLTASFNGSADETGSITFIDSSGSAPVTIGSAALASGAASFPLGSLTAGTHAIFAAYSGDPSHGASQSSTLPITVTPLAVTATATPASMLYGQAVPALDGTVTGLLVPDAGKVMGVFSTTAGPLSAAGVYPITATLSGTAATNYSVSDVPASLTIAKAPTTTSLSSNLSSPGLGVPVTLSIQAASTSSGVPTGSITVFDGASSLGTAQISAAGVTSLTLSALAQGTHTFTAVYSGDSNFLASTSAASTLVVGAASDFILAPTGATSQSVAAGSAATFGFAVTMQGTAMVSPIALAVQGTPTGSTASLNPAYIPPGGSVTSFTLTVQTPLADMRGKPVLHGPGASPISPLLAVLLLPGLGLVMELRRIKWKMLSTVLATGGSCIVFFTFMTGCGDRINTAAESANATSYTLTVTGTATSASGAGLQHAASVTLKVL
jgi:sugar lactone lactonase YvrE